jgi:hypothetical protein
VSDAPLLVEARIVDKKIQTINQCLFAFKEEIIE